MNIHNSLGKHKIIMEVSERCQSHVMQAKKTKVAKLDVKRRTWWSTTHPSACRTAGGRTTAPSPDASSKRGSWTTLMVCVGHGSYETLCK